MTKKRRLPAIVLLTKDSISRGVLPSAETLEAVFHELDNKDFFLDVALAILEAKSGPVVAQTQPTPTKATQTPVERPRQQKVDKPKLNPEAVVSSTAMLESGRMSIISKKN